MMDKFISWMRSLYNEKINIKILSDIFLRLIIFSTMFFIFNHFHFFDSVFHINYLEAGGNHSKPSSQTPSPDNSPVSGQYRVTTEVLNIDPNKMTGLVNTAQNTSPHYVIRTNRDINDFASANYFDVYANNEKHLNECKK